MYRRNGTPVDTPVHIATRGDRAFIRTYETAYKTGRLRRRPEAELRPASTGQVPALLALLRPKGQGAPVRLRARDLRGASLEKLLSFRLIGIESLPELGKQDRLQPGEPRVAVQELLRGQVAWQADVAWQVADPPVDGENVPLCVEAEERDPASGLPQNVEQAAEGGGLACPVGAPEAEDLARSTLNEMSRTALTGGLRG